MEVPRPLENYTLAGLRVEHMLWHGRGKNELEEQMQSPKGEVVWGCAPLRLGRGYLSEVVPRTT